MVSFTRPEPPSIRFCPDFQGLIRVYGITIKYTAFPASFAGSLWLVFPLSTQKLGTMRDHAVKSELSHGHSTFSWNDDTKYGK